MRKVLFIVFAVLCLSSLNAQTNAIKVNPLGLAFGVANAGYEFATSDKQSLTFSGLYYDIDGISGFGGGAEYRFYFSDEALRGWHAGPTVGFLSLEDDFNTTATAFTVGGDAGYQWIFGEHFALDVFAGLGYVIGADDLTGLNSVAVGLGVSLGYAW